MRELEKIEIDLLKEIYEQEFNFKKINWDAIGFESNNQKAYYLKRLEIDRLIELEENTLVSGGQRDKKYKTAIVMVYSEGIHILKDGIELVKELNR